MRRDKTPQPADKDEKLRQWLRHREFWWAWHEKHYKVTDPRVLEEGRTPPVDPDVPAAWRRSAR